MSKTCPSCGKTLDDQTKFCDGCGKDQSAAANMNGQQNSQNQSANFFDPQDIEKNKTVSALAYLIFFLPLIVCPDSKFGRFHANQGLLLTIVAIAGSFILGLIPILGWILLIFFPFVIIAFMIIGFVNAIKGLTKQLPIFGKLEIIK